MARNRGTGRALSAWLALATLGACGGSEAQQPDRADSVVRSAVLETSGSVSGEFRAVDLADAKLIGRCDADMWANFGISFSAEGWRKVGVTIMSEDEIEPGQVGPIALDWAVVSVTDDQWDSVDFRGPAAFEITLHDAAAPRMSGTVRGKIPGYSGLAGGGKVESDRSIDFEFTFDINAACGV